MSNRATYVKQSTTLVIALSCIALSSIGGADSVVEKKKPANIADQELFFAPVPKAVCGPGDTPETGLQGQVPAAMRAAGFQGFSSNLQLLAQIKGEGASWQTDEHREGKGKNKKVCAYHSTDRPETSGSLPGRNNLGTRVIDISDPAKPVNTAYLTTPAMLYPHESLRVNERRKLLGGGHEAHAEVDFYDVSGDCRYPQLLSSVALFEPLDLPFFGPVIGHEGAFAPDGLTYYNSGRSSGGQTYAVDITDTTKPKIIGIGPGTHGLSISDDGTRGYIANSRGDVPTLQCGTCVAAPNALLVLADPAAPAVNGLDIYDLTEIQQRKANPQNKRIGSVRWKDGSATQVTIPVTIGKKPYVIFVDEGGSGGIASAAQFQLACSMGVAPFPMARIIDISDETNPKVVSKLMLEVHDPANCDKVAPDVAGLLIFTYGSHYCSVDNRSNATTLACGYFNSGIRVFDIRDPIRPREIAYYNAAGTATASPGSSHNLGGGWQPGGPDWCTAQLHLDAEQGTIWTTCMDNGLLSLKFTHNAWPFAESRTPPGRQN